MMLTERRGPHKISVEFPRNFLAMGRRLRLQLAAGPHKRPGITREERALNPSPPTPGHRPGPATTGGPARRTPEEITCSKENTMKTRILTAALAAGLAGTALADTTTTFDNGLEGWSISGRETINPVGGNPGANLHGVLTDVFGIDVRNNTNQAFLGDLSRYGSFELSIDVQVNSINMLGMEVPRDFVVELRDYDNDLGYPWTSVYYNLGTLSAADRGVDGWMTYSVVIDDP